MRGLVPRIHVFAAQAKEDVDGEPGHDEQSQASYWQVVT
jgi:hypothetical protein